MISSTKKNKMNIPLPDDLQNYLRKIGLKRKVKEIGANIYCVLSRVKASFLWDLGPTPSLSQLTKLRHCLNTDLMIIRLNGDFIFALKSSFEAMLKLLEHHPPVFIELTELSDPKIIELCDNKMDTFKIILANILKNQEDVVEVGVGCPSDLPTLVGLLLGFPIIYTVTGQGCACLDGTPLVLVTLNLTRPQIDNSNICVTSFSVPASLWNSERVGSAVAAWWTRVGGGVSWGHPMHMEGVTITLTTSTVIQPSVML